MTRPFRDPIIYPGVPMPTRAFVAKISRMCSVGDHRIEAGDMVRRGEFRGIACLPCAVRAENHAAEESTFWSPDAAA